jgi:hypothetical protein
MTIELNVSNIWRYDLLLYNVYFHSSYSRNFGQEESVVINIMADRGILMCIYSRSLTE